MNYSLFWYVSFVPFCGLNRSRPAIDLVHRVFVDLFLWRTEFFRRLKRMIAALDWKHLRGRSEIFDVRMNLFRCAKRVACALHKQHRLAHMWKVLNAKLRRLARWVKWISEK